MPAEEIVTWFVIYAIPVLMWFGIRSICFGRKIKWRYSFAIVLPIFVARVMHNRRFIPFFSPAWVILTIFVVGWCNFVFWVLGSSVTRSLPAPTDSLSTSKSSSFAISVLSLNKISVWSLIAQIVIRTHFLGLCCYFIIVAFVLCAMSSLQYTPFLLLVAAVYLALCARTSLVEFLQIHLSNTTSHTVKSSFVICSVILLSAVLLPQHHEHLSFASLSRPVDAESRRLLVDSAATIRAGMLNSLIAENKYYAACDDSPLCILVRPFVYQGEFPSVQDKAEIERQFHASFGTSLLKLEAHTIAQATNYDSPGKYRGQMMLVGIDETIKNTIPKPALILLSLPGRFVKAVATPIVSTEYLITEAPSVIQQEIVRSVASMQDVFSITNANHLWIAVAQAGADASSSAIKVSMSGYEWVCVRVLRVCEQICANVYQMHAYLFLWWEYTSVTLPALLYQSGSEFRAYLLGLWEYMSVTLPALLYQSVSEFCGRIALIPSRIGSSISSSFSLICQAVKEGFHEISHDLSVLGSFISRGAQNFYAMLSRCAHNTFGMFYYTFVTLPYLLYDTICSLHSLEPTWWTVTKDFFVFLGNFCVSLVRSVPASIASNVYDVWEKCNISDVKHMYDIVFDFFLYPFWRKICNVPQSCYLMYVSLSKELVMFVDAYHTVVSFPQNCFNFVEKICASIQDDLLSSWRNTVGELSWRKTQEILYNIMRMPIVFWHDSFVREFLQPIFNSLYWCAYAVISIPSAIFECLRFVSSNLVEVICLFGTIAMSFAMSTTNMLYNRYHSLSHNVHLTSGFSVGESLVTPADWLSVNARDVWITQQHVNVKPYQVNAQGPWVAEINVIEHYQVSDVHNTKREMGVWFNLPDTATVVGLQVGTNKSLLHAKLEPRGAVQKAFEESLQVSTKPPSVLEKVGPGKYRLRISPAFWSLTESPLVMQLKYLAFPSTTLYNGTSCNLSWPLPQLTQRRNVYFNHLTSRVIMGEETQSVWRLYTDWFPGFASTVVHNPSTDTMATTLPATDWAPLEKTQTADTHVLLGNREYKVSLSQSPQLVNHLRKPPPESVALLLDASFRMGELVDRVNEELLFTRRRVCSEEGNSLHLFVGVSEWEQSQRLQMERHDLCAEKHFAVDKYVFLGSQSIETVWRQFWKTHFPNATSSNTTASAANAAAPGNTTGGSFYTQVAILSNEAHQDGVVDSPGKGDLANSRALPLVSVVFLGPDKPEEFADSVSDLLLAAGGEVFGSVRESLVYASMRNAGPDRTVASIQGLLHASSETNVTAMRTESDGVIQQWTLDKVPFVGPVSSSSHSRTAGQKVFWQLASHTLTKVFGGCGGLDKISKVMCLDTVHALSESAHCVSQLSSFIIAGSQANEELVRELSVAEDRFDRHSDRRRAVEGFRKDKKIEAMEAVNKLRSSPVVSLLQTPVVQKKQYVAQQPVRSPGSPLKSFGGNEDDSMFVSSGPTSGFVVMWLLILCFFAGTVA